MTILVGFALLFCDKNFGIVNVTDINQQNKGGYRFMFKIPLFIQ